MKAMKMTSILFLFAFLIVAVSTVFTVSQGRHGLLLRLGRLVEAPQKDDNAERIIKILSPGLHFKIPFIETVRIFDTRLQTLDIKSSRIVTKEKKDVLVDFYVKWRIADLPYYFKATGGNSLKAESLLEQQLNTSLRAQFGKRTIPQVVSGERDDIMGVLKEQAEAQAKELGIYVVDVRIKGIELPQGTSNAIYQRMRADMQKIANKHRADGQAQAEEIRANADAEAAIIVANAKSNGLVTRARGQALAASIFSDSFSKNDKFFSFYRSLKAYEASFNSKQDMLVLDQSNKFFDYFKNGYPAQP